MACMAVLRATRKLLAVGHGGRRFNLPLRPPFWPSRDPLLLRIFPVLSYMLYMDCGPPNRARRRDPCRRPWLASPVLLFRPAKTPQADPSRPLRDLRPEIEDTPSGVNFLKSPWIFLSPNPPSLAYFLEYAFSF